MPSSDADRWPTSLTLIRHGRSAYNDVTKQKNNLPAYQNFQQAFDATYFANKEVEQVQPTLRRAIIDKQWPTAEIVALAQAADEAIQQLMNNVSDYSTPLVALGTQQATELGEASAEHLPHPDYIYYSPYLRTRQTMTAILAGRPDLNQVPQWMNEDIREKEHGMATVFNDWRLLFTFNPYQALLYNKDPYGYQYPGGESDYNVRGRTSAALGRMSRKHAGQNIWWITHHLTILSTIGEVAHWTREEFMQADEVSKPVNCGVTILRNQPEASSTGKDVLTLADSDYNQVFYSCARE